MDKVGEGKIYKYVNGEFIEVGTDFGTEDRSQDLGAIIRQDIGTTGALFKAGQSLAFDKELYGDPKSAGINNNVRLGASVGLGLLSGAGDFLAGYGNEKKYNRTLEEYYRKQQEKNAEDYTQSAVGGEVQATTNVEGGEVLQTPDGQIIPIEGASHEQGGKNIQAPPATKIMSDRIIIGNMAKVLNKEVKGLKLRGGDTVAGAFKKFEEFMNVDKNLKSLNKLIKKAEQNSSETKDVATRGVNSAYIKQQLEDEKNDLAIKEAKIEEFGTLLFGIQEQVKGTAPSQIIQPEAQPQLDPISQSQLEAQQQNQPQTQQFPQNQQEPVQEPVQQSAVGGVTAPQTTPPTTPPVYDPSGTLSVNPVSLRHLMHYLASRGISTDDQQDILDVLSTDGVASDQLAALADNSGLGIVTKFVEKTQGQPAADIEAASSTWDFRASPASSLNGFATFIGDTTPSATKKTAGDLKIERHSKDPGTLTKKQPFTRQFTLTGLLDEGNFNSRMGEIVKFFPKILEEGWINKRADGTLDPSLSNQNITDIQNYINNQYTTYQTLSKDQQGMVNKLDELGFNGEKFRKIEGLGGTFTSSRSGVSINMVSQSTRDKLEAQGITHFDDIDIAQLEHFSADELANYEAIKARIETEGNHVNPIIGITSSGATRVQEQELESLAARYMPIDREEPEFKMRAKGTPPDVTARGDVHNLQILPDGYIDPPEGLTVHTKVNNDLERLDPTKITDEQVLENAARTEQFTAAELAKMPDQARRAVLSNMLASSQEKTNASLVKIDQLNVNNQVQVDKFNAKQSDREDGLDNAETLRYEKLQLLAQAKTDEDMSNYFLKMREMRLNASAFDNNAELLSAMRQNFSVDPITGKLVYQDGGAIVTAGTVGQGLDLTKVPNIENETPEEKDLRKAKLKAQVAARKAALKKAGR